MLGRIFRRKNYEAEKGVDQDSEIAKLLDQVVTSQRDLAKAIEQVHLSIEAASKLNARVALGGASTSVFMTDLLRISGSFRGTHDPTRFLRFLNTYLLHIDEISDKLYIRLDAEDRESFLRWFLLRYAKINILRDGEREDYGILLASIRSLPVVDTIKHKGKKYNIKNVNAAGCDFSFIHTSDYVFANDFYLRQYHHKNVNVRPGDVIIDAGAYTGDTAFIFANDANHDCDIHCFEIAQANIDAFEANILLNPKFKDRIHINKFALSERSNDTLYLDEGAHAGEVFSAFTAGTERTGVSVPTITIDHYVESRGLKRVDMIKMDIEGAERSALAGARETIRKFKPRLAIPIYHLWDDAFVIPEIILDININYEIYFNWYNKRLANEAVVYAIDRDELNARARAAEPDAARHPVGARALG